MAALARPTVGPVSSPFGWRWNYTDWHGGVDFSAPIGTPVYAAESGRVVNVWSDGAMSKYGRTIVIEHDSPVPAPYSLYAHLSGASVVKGQHVNKGQRIGSTGITAASTADATRTVPPHLHFELLTRWPPPAPDAYRVDPSAALGLSGSGLGVGSLLVLGGAGWWLLRSRGRLQRRRGRR